MKKFCEKFSDYYLTFCVYALIGWLYEVLWYIIVRHRFVNRGVLIGPFLPIYGFGMLILLILLKEFMKKKREKKEPLYFAISTITITSFIYTTIIEYTTPKIYLVSDYLRQYGIGLIIINILVMIMVRMLMKKNKKWQEIDTTIVIVFLLIWIITTLLEYISHFVMDKYFHTILWDYSTDFLNIKARVNWDASRNFAIGGTILLYTIQPLLNKYLPKIQSNRKTLITAIIGIPMLLDFILHVILK